jgi:hypothetical protein
VLLTRPSPTYLLCNPEICVPASKLTEPEIVVAPVKEAFEIGDPDIINIANIKYYTKK